jgi:histidinol phosphatase-like PHP family hydrolase
MKQITSTAKRYAFDPHAFLSTIGQGSGDDVACEEESADWARVLAVAAELDKAVGIDSYPDRQDVSIDLIKQARRVGCQISIGTDSHGPSQLEFIEFGRAAALKAKIDPDRSLNFMSRDDLTEWASRLCDLAGIHEYQELPELVAGVRPGP